MTRKYIVKKIEKLEKKLNKVNFIEIESEIKSLLTYLYYIEN